MKANRKLIIPLGIILLLGILYFLTSLRDRSADLPELKKWSGEADEITIARPGDSLRIYRKEGRWVIGDQAYPADDKIVGTLLEKLKNLQITELSSTRPYYEKFDLTSEKALPVTVKQGGRVLRDLLIGKRSETTSHTFIQLKGRAEVYKVSGLQREDCDKGLNEWRDKSIINVPAKNISSLQILHKGKSLTFEKITGVKASPGPAPDKAKPEAAERWICREHNNLILDERKTQALIRSFGPMKAFNFADIEAKSLKNAETLIKINAAGKTYEVRIYSKTKGDQYPCTSSELPYIFLLDKFGAERYAKDIKEYVQQ